MKIVYTCFLGRFAVILHLPVHAAYIAVALSWLGICSSSISYVLPLPDFQPEVWGHDLEISCSLYTYNRSGFFQWNIQLDDELFLPLKCSPCGQQETEMRNFRSFPVLRLLIHLAKEDHSNSRSNKFLAKCNITPLLQKGRKEGKEKEEKNKRDWQREYFLTLRTIQPTFQTISLLWVLLPIYSVLPLPPKFATWASTWGFLVLCWNLLWSFNFKRARNGKDFK